MATNSHVFKLVVFFFFFWRGGEEGSCKQEVNQKLLTKSFYSNYAEVFVSSRNQELVA